MTDREKLIELLENDDCPLLYVLGENVGALADHLIANGVRLESSLEKKQATSEESERWIPVTERLPERTMPPHDVLVYHDLGCGMYVDRAWYSYDKRRWCSVLGMKLKVTHWMPLPEPPKGDEG